MREFDHKWLRGGAPADEPLIGSADIQSLADLGNSFEVVKGMRWVPFTLQTVLQLAVTTLLPVVPLTLTMISLEELLDGAQDCLLSQRSCDSVPANVQVRCYPHAPRRLVRVSRRRRGVSTCSDTSMLRQDQEAQGELK